MEQSVIIPAPTRMEHRGSYVPKTGCGAELCVNAASASRITDVAVLQLESWLNKHWGGPITRNAHVEEELAENDSAFRFLFSVTAEEGEGYRLHADRKGARLSGGPKGILYAVQTLLRLMESETTPESPAVPLVSIEDRPDVPIRGLFIECHWGSDLMDEQDWQSMIDEMVSLKLNTLNIGLYGCWYSRHPDSEGSAPEFLFAPVIDDPNRLPPSSVRYFDPETNRWETKRYTPVMYERDLFGSLIGYAAERGIRVVPLFNGPGHSTLLPKLYPHISAVNEQGQPTGYGYTLEHPDTLPMLKRINERIVERYMKPYGQTWFHIGVDEVARWSGADLASHTPRELICRYIVELGSHLVGLGMEKVILWHDCAEHLTGFDEPFEQMLREHGLAGKIVIHWWKYGEPELGIRQVPGTENWVAPCAGYTGSMFAQDYLDNIDMMVDDGSRADLQGVVPYMMYSPTQRRNVAYVAEKSWNVQARADDFEKRYARLIVKDAAEAWAEGMRFMRKTFGYSSSSMLIAGLPAYFSENPTNNPYPARVINSIRALRGTRWAYDTILVSLRKALRLFEQGEARPGKEYDVLLNRFECRRVETIVQTVLRMTDGINRYEQIRNGPLSQRTKLTELRNDLVQALQELDAIMLEMKRFLPPYLVPAGLRYYSPLREALRLLVEQMDGLVEDRAAMAGETPLPFPALPGLHIQTD